MNKRILILLSFLFLASVTSAQKSVEEINKTHELLKEIAWDNPDSAIKICKDLLVHTKEYPNDSLTAKTYYYLGLANYFRQYLLLSIDYYIKGANTNYASNNIRFKGKCLNNMGICYEMIHDYDQAMKSYLASLEIDAQLGDSTGVALSKINIGLLYLNLNQPEQGIKHTQEAKVYFERINDTEGLALANHNLGRIKLDQGNNTLAAAFFRKATILYKKSANNYELANSYIAIATAETNQKHYSEASLNLDKAEELILKHNYTFLYTRLQLARTDMLINTNKFEEARELLNEIETDFQPHQLQKRYYKVILNKDIEDIDAFQGILTDYATFMDSVSLASNSEMVNQLHIQYEIKEKDKEIEQHKQQVIDQKNRIFLILGILLLAIFILILIIIYNRKLRKSYKVLFDQSEEMRKSLLYSKAAWQERPIGKEEDFNDTTLFEKVRSVLVKDDLFMDSELTIDLLAEKCNSNRTYVSKAINDNTQTNFKGFINRYRIEKTKELLLNTNYSLDWIAKECGFKSESTFYRAFKNVTGLTPRQYRDYSEK